MSAADLRPIAEGLKVTAQNVSGTAEHDRGAVLDRLGRFMPVGFYYRSFFRPGAKSWLKFWEPMIRKSAGLGKVDPAAESRPLHQGKPAHRRAGRRRGPGRPFGRRQGSRGGGAGAAGRFEPGTRRRPDLCALRARDGRGGGDPEDAARSGRKAGQSAGADRCHMQWLVCRQLASGAAGRGALSGSRQAGRGGRGFA